MDVLGCLFVPNWVLWIAGVLLTLYLYGTWPHGRLRATGLPGPPLKPFVGSMMDMFSYPKHAGEYYLSLRKKYGPLIRLSDARLPVIVIFDLDLIKAVLIREHSKFTDRRTLPNRGIMTNSLLDRLGQPWKENRALITPFFTSGKLKNNFATLKRCCDNMINNMKKACDDNKTIETKEYTGYYTMDVICSTGFGLDVDSANDPNNPFIVNARELSSVRLDSLPTVIAVVFPFLGKLMNWCGVRMLPDNMVDFFTRATLEAMDLRLKSKHRRPDFVDAMIRAHEEEIDAETRKDLGNMSQEQVDKMKRKGLTREEIIANGILLFLAGYDTTSTSLSFLMYALAHHQDWQEKCLEEVREVIGDNDVDYEVVSKLEVMDMCIEETQRMFPIVYFLDRVAVEDVTINGLTIPKGTSCVVPVWAIHHDPEYWPDPEKFDPLRFTPEAKQSRNPYSFLPFGLGPRNCVGMRLALLEIKVGLAKILQNFQLLTTDNSPFPPKLCKTLLVKIEDGLPLRMKPR